MVGRIFQYIIVRKAQNRKADPMKAWRFVKAFGLENIESVDVSVPEAGPGQAVVRVRACSLNYRDLVVSKGGYGRAVKVPLTPLSDGAGEVVAVGPGVTRIKPGDRVAGIFMQGWLDGPPDDAGAATALGGALDGMLAEMVCLDADGLVKYPEHLSYEEAATLPCAAVTAWHSLFESGGLKPGQTVLVQGTGGVSIFALQFAKMAGATVIATSSSAEKLEKLEALGADHLIDYRKNANWGEVARGLIHGAGIDHVIDVGGPATLEQSMIAARNGGHIALIGILTGLAGPFPVITVLLKQLQLKGVLVGSRRQQIDMIRAIDANGLKPVIDKSFGLEEIVAAFQYQESNRHFGKICLEF